LVEVSDTVVGVHVKFVVVAGQDTVTVYVPGGGTFTTIFAVAPPVPATSAPVYDPPPVPGIDAVIVPVGTPPLESVNVAVTVAVEPYGALAGEIVAASVPTAGETVSPTNVVLVLVAKFVSPTYVAVIVCDPTASAVVEKFAVPAASVALPSSVPFAKKFTLPVGTSAVVTLGSGVTFAVNVTFAPKVDVNVDELSPVTLAIVPPATFCAADVLVVKFGSPEYFAVSEWVCPGESVDVNVPVQTPPVQLSPPVPRLVVPSRNVTDPVGVAMFAPLTEGVTVPVITIDCPGFGGFGVKLSAVVDVPAAIVTCELFGVLHVKL
jgi:hypothetical protein